MTFNQFYIKIEPYAGAEIEKCCEQAAKLAETLECPVVFNFNGIEIIVQNGHRSSRADRAYNATQMYWKRRR